MSAPVNAQESGFSAGFSGVFGPIRTGGLTLHHPVDGSAADLLRTRTTKLYGNGIEYGGSVDLMGHYRHMRIGFSVGIVGLSGPNAQTTGLPQGVSLRTDSMWAEHISLSFGRELEFFSKSFRPYFDVRGTLTVGVVQAGLVTPEYGFMGTTPMNLFYPGIGPRGGIRYLFWEIGYFDASAYYGAYGLERFAATFGAGVFIDLAK